MLLRFAAPEPEALLGAAERSRARSTSTSPGSSRPKASSRFAELARDYFGAKADVDAGSGRAARACSRAPHYFRRLGKGRFRKAPEEIVKAALLGIERKRQVAVQVDAWAAELVAGSLPGADPRAALSHPVQARQERARVQGRRRGVAALRPGAARPAARRPARSTRRTSSTGAASCSRSSRRASASPTSPVPAIKEKLPLAPARGVLDRRLVDDRDRRRALGAGPRQRPGHVGIHIAAPALAVAPGSAVAQIARDRLSTVYIPGHKLTMLPDAVVDAFTLAEGRDAAGRLALRDDRRGDAGDAGERDAARARAASPPTCATTCSTTEINEETLAAGLPADRFRSPPSSRSCTAWRST